ncbi:hypothetical protein CK221_28885 [Mesorhizobium sp. WSM3868]|nr:hypothetical protein CK221_28885 [Mesorhizobium sp. WSM3868]
MVTDAATVKVAVLHFFDTPTAAGARNVSRGTPNVPLGAIYDSGATAGFIWRPTGMTQRN